MNKLKMTLSLAAIAAVGAAFAGSGKSGNLNLSTADTETVTTSSAAPTTGGWNTKPTFEGTYFDIDNDADTASVYTFAKSVSGKAYYESTFALKAAIVPKALGALEGNAEAKVGFCLYKDGTNPVHYAGYVNGAWVDLGEASLTEGAEYTLTITLDCSDGAYAQFKVGDTVLQNGETRWFATREATTVTESIFVGSGSVGTFSRSAYAIVSEAVPGIVMGDDETVRVDLSETSIAALATAAGGKANLASYLGRTGDNGMKNLDTYALFGKTSSAATDTVKMQGDAVNSNEDGISVKVPNVHVPDDMKSNVSFQLLGCKTKNGTYEVVPGVAANTTGSFTIPLGKIGTYKFFKIRATTSYTPAN